MSKSMVGAREGAPKFYVDLVIDERHGPAPAFDGELVVRRTPSTSAPADTRFLSRSDIARHLRVSTRWVERHLRPTAQASKRGRAWYTLEDVEAQLARMNIHKRATSASTVPSAAQSRARKVAATAQPRPDGAEHARRVAEIERSLLERSSDEHPRGAKTRRRK
jgi:hypothetical protein